MTSSAISMTLANINPIFVITLGNSTVDAKFKTYAQ